MGPRFWGNPEFKCLIVSPQNTATANKAAHRYQGVRSPQNPAHPALPLLTPRKHYCQATTRTTAFCSPRPGCTAALHASVTVGIPPFRPELRPLEHFRSRTPAHLTVPCTTHGWTDGLPTSLHPKLQTGAPACPLSSPEHLKLNKSPGL